MKISTFTPKILCMNRFSLSLFVFLFLQQGFSQNPDSLFVREIFNNALTNRDAYTNLGYLCEKAPGRLIGSETSLIALDYLRKYAEKIGVDTVFLQEFKSPAWKRNSASLKINSGKKKISIPCDALGNSPSSPENGIKAGIVEVKSLKEVEELGEAMISGKIVFYNRPWDQLAINTFAGYGRTVDQRSRGPAMAAKYGAVGVIVRSAGSGYDHFPHTGSTRYDDRKIPAVTISTLDADALSQALKEIPATTATIFTDCEDIQEVKTYNLIAQINGHEKPEEIIVVGGHIDAWFNSPGAHDDGAGCVMSMDVLRIFKELKIENKRTIRTVMFMDEELYQSGGKAYAENAKNMNEKHILAIEADAGAFTPEGFMVDASELTTSKIIGFFPLLEPYGIDYIKKGGTGVDIAPLKQQGVNLVGYRTDSQRYFDLHHSANDTFGQINFRELQLGSGNLAGLVYLVDKYGVE
jgi:hypothetical protein